MRVVLDTNIIVSALIAPAGKPAAIIDAWLDGRFTLLTCTAHVDVAAGHAAKATCG
ncbi:MAG: PIN domain-containing protein [Bryobacteraceae bacterium]